MNLDITYVPVLFRLKYALYANAAFWDQLDKDPISAHKVIIQAYVRYLGTCTEVDEFLKNYLKV